MPACAGEPLCHEYNICIAWVYPRVCGGTTPDWALLPSADGLSPRVRGNHHHDRHQHPPGGSIPACAGEPCQTPWSRCHRLVYPRVCGGTHSIQSYHTADIGLSPRVRGNLQEVVGGGWTARSIPACAGEPPSSPPRGGRGRSIPACAGEPPLWLRSHQRHWVYPRVCGGTFPRRSQRRRASGLSPRVRGNPDSRIKHATLSRSIPACAGEPALNLVSNLQVEVYPRVCGEPPTGTPGTAAPGVYPRVCGGTIDPNVEPGDLPGLSPRVRGNPVQEAGYPRSRRSIPACAGEPRTPGS